MLALAAPIMVIIRQTSETSRGRISTETITMKTKVSAGLFALALLSACSTTPTADHHQTLEQRLMDKYAGADVTAAEPAPPAEGPEDIPAEAPADPVHNPTLEPTPLLRQSAASSTP
jgi:hypothetical protein